MTALRVDASAAWRRNGSGRDEWSTRRYLSICGSNRRLTGDVEMLQDLILAASQLNAIARSMRSTAESDLGMPLAVSTCPGLGSGKGNANARLR
jgi:hypothetical protein